MATHSSVLAWRIPGTGKPGGLPSMGSHRIGPRLKGLSSSRLPGGRGWGLVIVPSGVSAFQWHFKTFKEHIVFIHVKYGWAALEAEMVKNPPAMLETWVQSLLGRSPEGGNGNPLQYSCLENSMDRGVWQATVHEVAKSWTQLSV